VQAAAQLLRALAHGLQAVAARCTAVDAAAVVGDRQPDAAVCGADRDMARRGVGVAHRVGHRLGDDPERGHLGRRRQVGQVADLEAERQRRAGGQPLRRLGQRGGQAELVESRRPQAFDDAPHLQHGSPQLVA
jgi:hypothetical protein